MSNVPVSIAYTSPALIANPNSRGYPNDSGVTITNDDASNDCKLWYRVGGAAEIPHKTTNGGGYYTVHAVNTGISFKITDTSMTTPPALSQLFGSRFRRGIAWRSAQRAGGLRLAVPRSEASFGF